MKAPEPTRDHFTLRIAPTCGLFTEALARTHKVLVEGRWTKGDEDWTNCPNCVTPWKCNGPHEPGP